MFSCLPTCHVRDLIFSQFSIDRCQKCVCFGALPRAPLGDLQRPQTPSWIELGHKPIGVNRPAFGGTVPHLHQMSRGPAKSADVLHFWKIVLLFFSLLIILHVCLATQQSDELRIKIGSKFARQQAYYRSVRQMPSILHARQPSPTTVYFFNAATPASSVNTATVVFTATLEYNTTHSAAAK